MRSIYYPGVCTKPGTYYQGWFVYMRYTQGQNEEYLLPRNVCTYILTQQVLLYTLTSNTTIICSSYEYNYQAMNIIIERLLVRIPDHCCTIFDALFLHETLCYHQNSTERSST